MMKNRLCAFLSVLCLGLAPAPARTAEDEPSELNWETFGRDIDVFNDFLRYHERRPPSGATEEICPASFPAATVRPAAFMTNPGQWKTAEVGGEEVLRAPYGHNTTMARARLRIEEPGAYRVWVRYYHLHGYAASFSLRILPLELAEQTDPAVVSSRSEYYAHRFDWSAHNPKRPDPPPDFKDEPTGFRWECGPLVELAPGEYTLELSTLVHGGPFTFRNVALIAFTADPLLDGPGELVDRSEYPASDATRRHWNAWSRRPGALSWEILPPELRAYYREWRTAFLEKLAERPENDAEKRLAARSYFDEDVNLIGTPADIAAEKRKLAAESRAGAGRAFALAVEAEDMAVKNGWAPSERMGASSGHVMEAAYVNGAASASLPVTLPRAGKYYIWARYFLFHKYYALFSLEFADHRNRELAALPFGEPEDRLQRPNNGFTWERQSVELPAGRLRLSLTKNIGKGPYTYRRVDKVFITDSETLDPDTYRPTASDKATTLWMQDDPWGAFSRFSLPRQGDRVEPAEVSLRIPRGDAASVLLHFRNDTDKPFELEPRLIGEGAPLPRLITYLNTPIYSWTPGVLLERSRIVAPPEQNTSLWLTFSTADLTEGEYASRLALGDRHVDFRVEVTPANNVRPVPLVGGWCRPLERESCWEMFREIGLNLVFNVVVSKEEMRRYGVKHFCLSPGVFETGALLEKEKTFRQLGLEREDWSAFLIDEPTASSVDAWLEKAWALRAALPGALIWCNPGEVHGCTPEIVRRMRPYIDVFCPYLDHFSAKDEAYRTGELPAIGTVKLLYTTPCFNEKASNAPHELLFLGQKAAELERDGWAPFSLFSSYQYSNSIWDEMHAFNRAQAIAFYPGAYGKTLGTRNLEAMREAIQRFRKQPYPP